MEIQRKLFDASLLLTPETARKEKLLDRPKNQTAEVLYELLTHKSITRRELFLNTDILSPTSRITDLRKLGLEILCEHKNVKNKHGRSVTFGSWSLSDREEGLKVYRAINL